MSSIEFNLADLEDAIKRHLPKYSGSLIADDLVKVVRAGASWGGHIKKTLQQELQECIQQDLQLLPEREMVERFNTQVEEFQREVEQIELRIAQLQKGREE